MGTDKTETLNSIRSILKKQDRRLFSIFIIHQIKEMEAIPKIPERKYTLWFLLFLLKMTGEHSSFHPYRSPTSVDLDRLHRLCIDLGDFVSPEFDDGTDTTVAKLLRCVYNQQFWFQESLSQRQIGRTLKICSIAQDFSRSGERTSAFETGLPWRTFVHHMLVILAWNHNCSPGSIFLPNEVSIAVTDKEGFNRILQEITIDVSDVRKHIDQNERISNPLLQLSQPTFFFRFPIWRIDNNNYIVSSSVLQKTLWFLPLDYIHQHSDDQTLLSRSFERYISNILEFHAFSFIRETSIQKDHPNEKVVDFAINTGEGTILIESKGILVHPIAKTFPKQSTLISTFKDTIIKAIVQGENTARILHGQGFQGPYYLYIVTLEELYFGSTPDLLREFIMLGLTTHFPEHRFERIDPNHIFIISINDFEQLIDESTFCPLSKITAEMADRQSKKSYNSFLYHLAQVSGRNNGRTRFHQMITDPLFEEVEEDARKALRDHSPWKQAGN